MPDYMFLLESRLSPEQRAALVRVQEIAQGQGTNVYLSGGAVRDLITGLPIRDLDFTVEGNPARIARELEKGGARLRSEDERLRHIEVLFHGDVDGSLAAARDEYYARPGSRPEMRWSTIIEDLRRRDFSCNAIALSLNLASRGLLLDPTNGLADLEKREVRLLSMHGFTNQPARLLRVLRYQVRLDFAIEARTKEWFALALERDLHHAMAPEDIGRELRQLGREDRPGAILKAWAAHGLLEAIHERLGRRGADYHGLAKLMKTREAMVSAGYRQLIGDTVLPRMFAPVAYYVFAKLTPRERNALLSRTGFRSAEIEQVASFEEGARKAVRLLSTRQMEKPREAYHYLEKLPLSWLAFIQAEFPKPRVLNKIRNFLYKWKPLRAALPVAELDALGLPRGPKFDRVLESFFDLQLAGKGKTPEERTKLLRKLAGIKPPAKKKEKKEKEKKKAARKEKPKAEHRAAPTPPAEPAVPLAPPARPPAEKPAAPPPQAEPAKPARKPVPKKRMRPAKKRRR